MSRGLAGPAWAHSGRRSAPCAGRSCVVAGRHTPPHSETRLGAGSGSRRSGLQVRRAGAAATVRSDGRRHRGRRQGEAAAERQMAEGREGAMEGSSS